MLVNTVTQIQMETTPAVKRGHTRNDVVLSSEYGYDWELTGGDCARAIAPT